MGKPLSILILIPELKEIEPEDNLATLSTAKEIERHYHALGHKTVIEHFDYTPQSFKIMVQKVQPDCVFNLVESVSGTSRLIHVPPIYMEELRVAYTGCGPHAIELSNDKVQAKRILNFAGAPTPAWGTSKNLPPKPGVTWIVKAQHEHASFGLSQRNVVKTTEAAKELAASLTKEHNIDWIIEEYVDGREFNVSMVETADGPRTLPVAEIVFDNYDSSRFKIIDYKAKWDEQSFEYKNTNRRYDFPAQDRKLINKLEQISLTVWDAFDFKGWGRIDFRVDIAGNCFVVDVNANPDLSLDAGFMAAAQRAEIAPARAIQMITDAALADL